VKYDAGEVLRDFIKYDAKPKYLIIQMLKELKRKR